MMKRIISVIIIIVVILSCFCFDTTAANNKKLSDYKKELADLQSKKSSNDALKASTLAEISQKQKEIANAQKEIENNEKKVEEAKIKIKESEEKIVKTTEEMNELLRFLQISDGQGSYLEYIAASNTISELIKRFAITEQISSYQKEKLGELKNLIEEKKQLQIDLAERNKQLEQQKIELQEKTDKLHEYLDSVAKIGMDYSNQIDAQKKVIAMYEKIGCKDDDYIQTCYYDKLFPPKGKSSSSAAVVVSDVGFSRPLAKGKVNQAYHSGHGGIDLGGNGESIYGKTVYAAAAGVVVTVSPRNKCGGNIIYIQHNIGGRQYTTEYAHLSAMYVSVGQIVTSSTAIGAVGGNPSIQTWDHCTTGPHLHYSIANGYWTYTGSAHKASTTPTGTSSVSGISNTKGWSWTSR